MVDTSITTMVNAVAAKLGGRTEGGAATSEFCATFCVTTQLGQAP